MVIPVLLAASTLFHQVLVVERAADETVLETRYLSQEEASDFAKQLAKEGAHVVAAPSLLGQEDHEAALEVLGSETEVSLKTSVSEGNARLDFELHGKEKRMHARAHLALRDGVIFVVPIDARHLLIGRQTKLPDGVEPDAASKSWRATWKPLLDAP